MSELTVWQLRKKIQEEQDAIYIEYSALISGVDSSQMSEREKSVAKRILFSAQQSAVAPYISALQLIDEHL